MRSDLRVSRSLAALSGPIASYRTAVATTMEELRGLLAARSIDANARAERLKHQLGPFGGARVRADRLAAILGDGPLLDPAALHRMERALETLQSIARDGDALFTADVPPGSSTGAIAAAQLGRAGRAFAAARIAATAQRGAASGLDEDAALDLFPFGEWNAAQRSLAPPLVITVAGADLNAGALASFLDGAQKIVLIATGDCAPAPLVRLITPSVFVAQVYEPEDLDRFAAWPGPAVAALVPRTCARIVHDPSRGNAFWQRLAIEVPPERRVSRLGGLTAGQQNEELHHLIALASGPEAMAQAREDTSVPRAAEPADRLAAWLLQQAGLGPGPGA